MNKFSKRESAILKILGRRKMTLDEISKELFKDKDDKPFYDTISIANSVATIIRKCSYYKLEWTLKKITGNKKLTIKKEKVRC